MAVSNFYGMNLIVTHSPVAADLQFRGFEGVRHFDGQSLFDQDSRVEQVRARTFIKFLEQNLKSQEQSKSPIEILLKQTVQWSHLKEDKQLFGQVSQAFFKQRGYFSRLFSGESWEEWTENRTALGKVVSHLRDCIESHPQVDSFTTRMDEKVVRTANNEAEALLGSLDHRDAATERSFRIESQSSCATGLVGGTFGSLLTQHPLPLLLGLSSCFPGVHGQQKVGSEFQVNTYIVDNQMYPTVESFPNGNFVVTWYSWDQDGSGWGVYGQIFNETGTKIGSEFQVNTYTLDEQSRPSVTSLNNRNFVVTWQSLGQDGSNWGVYGQIFNGIGTKIGSEFQVNTFTTNDQAAPSVAELSNGNFVVSWHSAQDANLYGVYGQIFNGTGSKIGNEFRINTYETDAQAWPSVAGLNGGDFVVTWMSNWQDGDRNGIYGQICNGQGTKIGNEFRLNSYAFDEQWGQRSSSFTNGNFVVIWTSNWQDGDLGGVYGRLFNGQGEKIGREFLVNTEFVNEQTYSHVASLSNDHFVVTWQSFSQDGSSWGVYGQLFDNNGAKIGNEFQVNTYTPNSQGFPSIAGLQDGNFVVTWHSEGQDGSGFGIYGLIFHDNFTLSSSASVTSTFQTTSTTSGFLSSSSTTRSTTRTTNRITTATIPVTSDSTSKVLLPSSKRNNNFLWFLLGASGWAACFVLTGYLFFKSKRREEGGDVVELSEKANDPHEDAGDYRCLGDLRGDSSQDEYANRPKGAPLGEGYGNVASVEENE